MGMKVRTQDGGNYGVNVGSAIIGAATGASGGAFVGGALQAAAGIGQTIYGFNQLKKANAQMDEYLRTDPDGSVKQTCKRPNGF